MNRRGFFRLLAGAPVAALAVAFGKPEKAASEWVSMSRHKEIRAIVPEVYTGVAQGWIREPIIFEQSIVHDRSSGHIIDVT